MIIADFTRKTAMLLGVSTLALTFAIAVAPEFSPNTGAAFAASDNAGGGSSGSDDGGNQGGNDSSGNNDSGSGPRGGAGEPDESDGEGPQAGQPTGDQGGSPNWAEGRIPEVELGRLNVARSPSHVLDQAYTEAVNNITQDMLDFYNMTLEEMVDALRNDFENQTYIDSPLANLALLRDALDGTSALTDLGVTTDVDTLMAVFLGVASDKGVTVTTDTAIAVSTILGEPLSEEDAEALAADAEAIRDAVEDGHG
ncbi:hypothetical protein [Thalassovita mangrovi]|uniref:Uncharacterized protein n=1 Tax=Thalassovita mangrovi TaxID=2692236 RepID=A0A6L8LUM4_9RHOB|nr:hypothetical protein [Thalassovita mangrovi]MYM57032.1 hypothetical protein [Thalassovita mangrovi]